MSCELRLGPRIKGFVNRRRHKGSFGGDQLGGHYRCGAAMMMMVMLMVVMMMMMMMIMMVMMVVVVMLVMYTDDEWRS